MKKVLLVTVLLLSHLFSQAQQDSIRVMHSIGLGYQYTQFGGFFGQQGNFGNNYNLDAGAFTMNLACHAICHRILYGAEFGGLSRKAINDDFTSATVTQGFGYFNIGYLIVDKPGFMAYPFAGIGGVYSGLVVKNKTATNWVDPDYVIRAGQHGNFSAMGASINAGISLRKNCNHKRYGKQLQLGIDLGVHITPQKRNWSYDGSDQAVYALGTSNNMGYYARVTIGGLMNRAVDKDQHHRKK